MVLGAGRWMGKGSGRTRECGTAALQRQNIRNDSNNLTYARFWGGRLDLWSRQRKTSRQPSMLCNSDRACYQDARPLAAKKDAAGG